MSMVARQAISFNYDFSMWFFYRRLTGTLQPARMHTSTRTDVDPTASRDIYGDDLYVRRWGYPHHSERHRSAYTIGLLVFFCIEGFSPHVREIASRRRSSIPDKLNKHSSNPEKRERSPARSEKKKKNKVQARVWRHSRQHIRSR